jgi:serine/threonine protein phosphatase PrpC
MGGSASVQPKTLVPQTIFTFSFLEIGVDTNIGKRASMEDNYIIERLDAKNFMLVVFDGHGGQQASTWLTHNFVRLWKKCAHHLGLDIYNDFCIKYAFECIDRFLKECCGSISCGSTAVVAFIRQATVDVSAEHPLGITHVIKTANIGDSRALHIRPELKTYTQCTKDHHASDVLETKRIKAAGYQVINGRVRGELILSRSFGDFQYKSNICMYDCAVTVVPHIEEFVVSSGDMLVLFSDGLIEKQNNAAVCLDAIRVKNLESNKIAHLLINNSLSRGSHDNHCAIVVKFI